MTRDTLVKRVGELADAVLADPRFERDDLTVAVLGMLLYGYALGTGRLFFFLDIPDIDAAVLQVMTDRVGAAAKWSGGLVAEANAAAFNREHHPGHHELIGVGHSYMTVQDRAALVDNVFANIASVRQRAG
jgi:hypothetical protein